MTQFGKPFAFETAFFKNPHTTSHNLFYNIHDGAVNGWEMYIWGGLFFNIYHSDMGSRFETLDSSMFTG